MLTTSGMPYIDSFSGKYNSIGRILDCGSKGYRFKSYYLPMFIRSVLNYFNNCCTVLVSLEVVLYQSLAFLKKFYLLQDILCQEGFLFDFLQKTFADVFIKKWLILSTYLFNERFLTDWLLKAFIKLIIFQGSLYAALGIISLKNTLYFIFSVIWVIIVLSLFITYYYIFIVLYI